MSTLRDIAHAHAARDPAAPFLVAPDNVHEPGRILTYGELLRLSLSLARHLRSRGLVAGDKVALLLPNGYQTTALFLGTMIGGFVVAPMNLSRLARRARLCARPLRLQAPLLLTRREGTARGRAAARQAQLPHRDDRCRRAGALRGRGRGGGARAGRRRGSGPPDVHLGHDRHAEGRAPQPSQPPRRRARGRGLARPHRGRPRAELAPALPHQRPGHRHALALRLGRQHRRAARLLGVALVGGCRAPSLHLDQPRADHHRLSLERGPAGGANSPICASAARLRRPCRPSITAPSRSASASGSSRPWG